MADDFADRVQSVIDEHGGGVEITFGQVTEDVQKGKVIIVQMGNVTLGDTEAGVFTLLSIAEAAAEMQAQPKDAVVAYAGLRDPSGGEGVVKVVDLIAYQEGEITGHQLRQRVDFDF